MGCAGDGVFEVRTSIDGEVIAKMDVDNRNVWTGLVSDIKLADGVYPFYITFKGHGGLQLLSFELI